MVSASIEKAALCPMISSSAAKVRVLVVVFIPAKVQQKDDIPSSDVNNYAYFTTFLPLIT
jgi:hypothetical protein